MRDPESDEIFYILNPPELFAYDTTYRAMYGVVGEKITGIERIECDHCHYLFISISMIRGVSTGTAASSLFPFRSTVPTWIIA